MSKWEEKLAFRHAPVVLQQVNKDFARADFITNIDFAYEWPEIYKNWKAVWKKEGGVYKYPLAAHGYYSVVETHTHYFLFYAFYHPQDWTKFWGDPATSSPSKLDQHLHDMEGCLAVVPKRKKNKNEEYTEALITISHYHFYSYAGWEDNQGNEIKRDFKIIGWTEDVDNPLQITTRFSGENEEPDYRFKLYVESGGHGIKGFKKGWGDEDHIIRYRPSLTTAQEPDENDFQKEDEKEDIYFQTVFYKLEPIIQKNGLWQQREEPDVIKPNTKGQDAFVKKQGSKTVPGSANPPWGWDDRDDRHQAGELAWDPAHIVKDYFTGLREFCREYVHNRYLDINKV